MTQLTRGLAGALLALLMISTAAADLKKDAILKQWVSRLYSSELHEGGYGTEGPVLRELYEDSYRFHRAEGNPEVALLHAVFGKRGDVARMGTREIWLFDKNLGMLAENLVSRPRSRGQNLTDTETCILENIRACSGSCGVIERPVEAPLSPAPLPLALLGRLPGALGNAFQIIEPRSLGQAGFLDILDRWATSPKLVSSIHWFCDRVAEMSRLARRGTIRGNVWHAALQGTQGNFRLATELLGVVVGQGKVALRYVETLVLPEARSQRVTDAFLKAAKTYFRLGIIHQVSLQQLGQSVVYPSRSRCTSPKFWHFYAAAALASNLRRLPLTDTAVSHTGTLIATGYELMTLPYNIRLEPERSGRVVARYVQDGLNDIRTQMLGNRFARHRDDDVAIQNIGGHAARMRRALQQRPFTRSPR